jgi:hypothetical protein
MTEAKWLSCSDPLAMLEFLRQSGSASDRKLRLFAAACSRRLWASLDELARAAVEVAEAYAEGLAGPEALRAARLACKSAGDSAAWYSAASNPNIAARNAALSAQAGSSAAERAVQADLVRDIFGNPIRPAQFDPRWLTTDLVALARTIYEVRSFERLPILADALRDAGCADDEILGHCRGKWPHVRGCWVVDALLGKS